MLDVHIADSLDSAAQSDPVLQIDLDMHAAFFREGTTLTADCSLLKRMNNYFADCTYAGDELTTLLDEIDSVSQRVPATSPCQPMLRQLRDACESAISTSNSIFVLCD